ncbi:MAG: hypothetical protein ABIK92_06785 [Pseudomonadota bacterium]
MSFWKRIFGDNYRKKSLNATDADMPAPNQGEDVNDSICSGSGNGETHIVLAIGEHDIDAVKRLIEEGADVTVKIDSDNTLLHYLALAFSLDLYNARTQGNSIAPIRDKLYKIAHILINAGVDPSIRNEDGKTAFDYVQGIADSEFEELFSSNNKVYREKSSATESACQIDNLWSGVSAVGDSIVSTDPKYKEKFADPIIRENPLQLGGFALAATISQYYALGGEGIYLFNIYGDPTIICRMKDANEKQIDHSCELFLNSIEMPTYPILRICLDWKRYDGSILSFESIPDLRSENVQSFFKAVVQSQKCWIHIVKDNVPMLSVASRLKFDTERIEFYVGEIKKALEYYKSLPMEALDYQKAIQEFYARRNRGQVYI